ncbi:MAG: protein kinase [Acidobacteriota bacterium]
MPLPGGNRLGPYEIVAPLGAGGMGEVYRARDTKLGREVAIKVLPAGVAQDPERLARFKREAQLLASLNHSNIAAIYGLDESGDTLFLVLELVEGEDLADRLKRGAVSLDDALAIAKQIAEALEEAHDKGLVHRDLKPANVKLTPDGKVKVLDFGLAKAYASDSSNAGSFDTDNSPTRAHAATVAGMILGTAAYMAPEQARGKAVDKRADIWAFGVVLYEMLTGSKLFDGETVSDTLAAVLTRPLDTKSLSTTTPPALRRLLRRCLERNPRNRLHDIADARIVIEDLLAGRIEEEDASVSATPRETTRRATGPANLLWLVAGLALGTLAVIGLERTLFAPKPSRPIFVRSLTYSGTSDDPSMSSDGRIVAFASDRDGTRRIWLKQLATGEEVALTAGPDAQPRISPDGSSLLFGRAAEVANDLFRVPLVGGEPRRLARNVADADWSPDGQRVVIARDLGDRGQLILIPADGGAEKLLLEKPEAIGAVAWSPDGRLISFDTFSRVNSVAHKALMTIEVATGAVHEVYRFPAGGRATPPCWDGNDTLLFAWSPSQAARGEILLQRLTLGSTTPRSVFSFSSMPRRVELAGPGALVFDNGAAPQNLFELTDHHELGRALTKGPTIDRQPAFSPDGLRVVFNSDRSGSLDLWSLELASGAVRRLTFDAADDWDPHWTPDGKHLIWSSNRTGHFEIWIAETDGSGARQVTSDGVDAENPTMSADGAWIVYSSSNLAAPGIWKIRPDGRDATHLLGGSFRLPDLAPKTNWIAAPTGLTTDLRGTPVRIFRLEDGKTVADLFVPGHMGNNGRSRWMPDSRTLVSWGSHPTYTTALYRQPIVPSSDTSSQRELAAVSSEKGVIESFGVSPIDGRIIVSARSLGERDVMMAEGVPEIGKSLPNR